MIVFWEFDSNTNNEVYECDIANYGVVCLLQMFVPLGWVWQYARIRNKSTNKNAKYNCPESSLKCKTRQVYV